MLVGQTWRRLAAYLLAFAAAELVVGVAVQSTSASRQGEYLQQVLERVRREYQGSLADYERVTRVYFEEVIDRPETRRLVAEAAHASSVRRDVLRRELYQDVAPSYRRMRKHHLRQLHFHLPDGTSFLRVHRPEEYGDALPGVRATIRLAIARKRPVVGLELGRHFLAFRFVYPIFHERQFVGSVETSVPFHMLQRLLHGASGSAYALVVKRSVAESKLHDEAYAYFHASDFGEELLQEKLDAARNFSAGREEAVSPQVIRTINGQARTRLLQRAAHDQSLVTVSKVSGVYYTAAFLPIGSLGGPVEAYLIAYTPDASPAGLERAAAIAYLLATSLVLAMLGVHAVLSQALRKRKQIELALRSSEERYRDLFENASDLILAADMNGRLLYANRAWCQALDLPPEAVSRMSLGDFVSWTSLGEWPQMLESLSQSCEVTGVEALFVGPGGREVVVEGSLNCRCDGDGADYMRAVWRDVSERKEVERMKDEFISVVSHEMRTPLTAICGSVKLLEGGVLGALTARAADVVHVARRNTDRLLRLVNQMLELNVLQSGHGRRSPQLLDADDLIKKTLEELSSIADGRAVQLEYRIADGGRYWWGDADQLARVVTNLVGNAIKFSPRGAKVTVASEGHESGGVHVRVRDEGAGIARDLHPLLFRPFGLADCSDSRSGTGTGLGLAICRAIIEDHGGEIGVRSEAGSGAEFWFVIPAAAAKSPSQQD